MSRDNNFQHDLAGEYAYMLHSAHGECRTVCLCIVPTFLLKFSGSNKSTSFVIEGGPIGQKIAWLSNFGAAAPVTLKSVGEHRRQCHEQ